MLWRNEKMKQLFENGFRNWAQLACSEWGYDTPPESYYQHVFERLPNGLRIILGYGIDRSLIIQMGKEFLLKGLDEKKGPYNWFSRDSSKKKPAPNWEYYVQVAEYVRLFELAERNNLRLTFEDDLMDIALYDGEKLIVCCEVKEQTSQLIKLLQGIREFQNDVKKIDFTIDDRHNDPLRKAKYILKKRPGYFYLISIGTKLEFSVGYPEDDTFNLKDDFIPYI